MINSTHISVFFYTNVYYVECVVEKATIFFNLDCFKRVVVWHLTVGKVIKVQILLLHFQFEQIFGIFNSLIFN